LVKLLKMLHIQNYISSSETESDTENNDEMTSHLKPIDKELSVGKCLDICAAPIVVPVVS